MNPEVIVLYLTIMTGVGKQDINSRLEMPDIKTCFEQAEKFLDHIFPASVDAKKLVAGCSREVSKVDPS